MGSKKYWIMRVLACQKSDMYTENERGVRKTASVLVVLGMLLMFPELFAVSLEFPLPLPCPSFWALLFVIGAFANICGYACLLFGWRLQLRYMKKLHDDGRRRLWRTKKSV
jgi:hypothetical protein